MNLAFVSPCFSEKAAGGIQLSARIAFDALTAASRDGAHVRCLCYGPSCDRSGEPICCRSKRIAAWQALKMRNWPGQVLFWHADMLKLLPFIGARGRRKLLFLHGIECWRKMDGLLARGLDQVDLFLSNSDFTWRRFIEMNPRWANAPHRTVALGVEQPLASVAGPADAPAAVMIGRMSKAEGYKGHEEVIGIWPEVLHAIPDAELWIVGGGDGEEHLRSVASRCEAAGRVRFFGVVSEEEKQELLRRSRCLLLPSRGEGFGLVYLEAMRLGRPCLASIHDAGREVIAAPDAGLAVDQANATELGAAIVRLLTPGGEWQRWSTGARRRYEAQFTAAHFQRRLHDAVMAEGER